MHPNLYFDIFIFQIIPKVELNISRMTFVRKYERMTGITKTVAEKPLRQKIVQLIDGDITLCMMMHGGHNDTFKVCGESGTTQEAEMPNTFNHHI